MLNSLIINTHHSTYIVVGFLVGGWNIKKEDSKLCVLREGFNTKRTFIFIEFSIKILPHFCCGKRVEFHLIFFFIEAFPKSIINTINSLSTLGFLSNEE